MATPAQVARAGGPAEVAHDLFERHGPAVFRFCRSRLRTVEEAEDACQTTFLRAFGALGRGVVPVSELSWLLKLADNVCRTRRQAARRRGAFEVAQDPAELGGIAAPAEPDRELLMPLEDALDRLTEAQRQALLLREWQGLTYREIAARLGISQGAVEVLLFRARRALAEELETPGRVRRRARVLDLGWLASALKQLFGGAAIAAKPALTAIAVAVVAAASTVAVALADDPVRPAQPVDVRTPLPAAPAPSLSQAVRPAERPATAPPRASKTPSSKPARQQRPRPQPQGAAPVGAHAPAPVEEPPQPAAAPARSDPVASTLGAVAPAVAEVVGTAEETVAELTETVEEVVEETLEEPALPPLPPAPPPPAPPPLPLP